VHATVLKQSAEYCKHSRKDLALRYSCRVSQLLCRRSYRHCEAKFTHTIVAKFVADFKNVYTGLVA